MNSRWLAGCFFGVMALLVLAAVGPPRFYGTFDGRVGSLSNANATLLFSGGAGTIPDARIGDNVTRSNLGYTWPERQYFPGGITGTNAAANFATTYVGRLLSDAGFDYGDTNWLKTNNNTWSGKLTVGTSLTKTNPINVCAYGADPSGSTDSTLAFNTALAAITPYSTFVVPDGVYVISNLTMWLSNQCTLKFSGRLLSTATNGVALTITTVPTNAAAKIDGLVLEAANLDWSQGVTGLQLVNLTGSEIYINTVDSFQTNLVLLGADAGFSGNRIRLGSVYDGLVNVEFKLTGGGGYCNENTIIGGTATETSGVTNYAGTIDVVLRGNNNKIIGMDTSGDAQTLAYEIEGSFHSIFAPRIEGPTNLVLAAGSQYNTVFAGYGLFSSLVTDNGTDNTVWALDNAKLGVDSLSLYRDAWAASSADAALFVKNRTYPNLSLSFGYESTNDMAYMVAQEPGVTLKPLHFYSSTNFFSGPVAGTNIWAHNRFYVGESGAYIQNYYGGIYVPNYVYSPTLVCSWIGPAGTTVGINTDVVEFCVGAGATWFTNAVYFKSNAIVSGSVTAGTGFTASNSVAPSVLGLKTCWFGTDGTNAIIVFSDGGGNRTTNKITVGSYP